MSSCLGVILAGGLSRRMQGDEKTLLSLCGKPLIAHVAEKLGAQVEPVLVNANGDPARFSFLSLPVQEDTVREHPGPLAGVLAGMRWASAHTECSHILTAASDTPFFPADYSTRMLDAAVKARAQIAIANSDERNHPVFGLWPVDLADALEDFLVTEHQRKVMLFVERYSHTIVTFETEGHDPFFNVNTPAELEHAERLALELIPS